VVRPRMLLRSSFRGEVVSLTAGLAMMVSSIVLVTEARPSGNDLDFHGTWVRGESQQSAPLQNQRLVLLGIDLDFEVVRGRTRAGAGGDLDGLPGRELSIMPAAEMGFPAVPGSCAAVELGPYRSSANIGGICWRMIPGRCR